MAGDQLAVAEVGAIELAHQLTAAEVVACLWLIGLQMQGPAEAGLRLGMTGQFLQRAAQIHQRTHVVWLQRQSTTGRLLRLRQLHAQPQGVGKV